MPSASFSGLRVLSLETRHAKEISKLIVSFGGKPVVASGHARSEARIRLSSARVCRRTDGRAI